MKQDIMMKLDSINHEISEPESAKIPTDARKPVPSESLSDGLETRKLLKSLSDDLVSTQKIIDVMMRRQENHDQTLQALSQEEFRNLSASATAEAKLPMESRDPPSGIGSQGLPETKNLGKDGKTELAFGHLASGAEYFEAGLGYQELYHFHTQVQKRSYWFDVVRSLNLNHMLVDQAPKTFAATIAQHRLFVLFQALLILAKTCIVTYECNLQVSRSLAASNESMPDWLHVVNFAFNIVFTIELFFRMFALRTWFWLSPEDWAWNIFDVVLICSALALDILGSTDNGFVFLRSFRILRLLRVARMVRVLRFFHQLREMLFALLACLESLMWCLAFMGITLFVFALMCLQGAADILERMDVGSLEENGELRRDVERRFGSTWTATLSLLASVTGGIDWLEVYDPLTYAGMLYPTVYIAYMLFITFGVMNVLTGVFLRNAEKIVDVDLIMQRQEAQTNEYVRHMLTVFREMDDGSGSVTYQGFLGALRNPQTQAFFQHLELDTTHARLIFDLLDREKTGKVEPIKFVMGMVRLKGNSKAIDTRVILRELGWLTQMLRELIRNDTCDVLGGC